MSDSREPHTNKRHGIPNALVLASLFAISGVLIWYSSQQSHALIDLRDHNARLIALLEQNPRADDVEALREREQELAEALLLARADLAASAELVNATLERGALLVEENAFLQWERAEALEEARVLREENVALQNAAIEWFAGLHSPGGEGSADPSVVLTEIARLRLENDEVRERSSHLEAIIEDLRSTVASARLELAGRDALVVELEEARATIIELEERLTSASEYVVLPTPPAVTPLAPPPAPESWRSPYGDARVNVPLEQYLHELLSTLADDAAAPTLPARHPLGAFFREDRDLILQGEVGSATTYRLTEWHEFNDFGDIVQRSVILIDAPVGTSTFSLVQQAITATRGAADRGDGGHLEWEIGTKRVTLRPDVGRTSRAVIEIEDAFRGANILKVYDRGD
jgi:hypothetical protein